MKSLIAIGIVSALILGCSSGTPKDEHAGHVPAESEPAAQYTCPMHPQVIQDKPGSCPVCGMDLVKVSKTKEGRADLMLSDSQMKLANISVQDVTTSTVGQALVINARLAANETLTEAISSRSAGRIEKLWIKETGRMVLAGEPLYEMYSETLLTLQREYLLAEEQFIALGASEPRYASFLEASKRKLLLYGLTQQQIENLGRSKTIQQRITFLAPSDGIVSEIAASEGQYIEEGALLYRLENIRQLWVEAELYPDESAYIRTGDKITVRVTGTDLPSLEARVIFLSPEYRTNTQITVMRAAIKNPGMQLKPGMQAQVHFTHSAHSAIAVPTDAVIRDGKGTHVYVEIGTHTFQPRMVTTGIENVDQVEIIQGLKEGERIAVTGAYLLYSEYILKKGTDPMAGHQH